MTLIPQPHPDFEKAYQSIDRVKRTIEAKNKQIAELDARAERYRRALLDILRVDFHHKSLGDAASHVTLRAALEIARKALSE